MNRIGCRAIMSMLVTATFRSDLKAQILPAAPPELPDLDHTYLSADPAMASSVESPKRSPSASSNFFCRLLILQKIPFL
jgi:hypothetical protein